MKRLQSKNKFLLAFVILVGVFALSYLVWTLQYANSDTGKTYPLLEYIPSPNSTIEELDDNEFLLQGSVTDVFDARYRDGYAGFVIDHRYRIVTDVAREHLTGAYEHKGNVAEIKIGDEVEVFAQRVPSERSTRYTIYGDRSYYATKQ